MEYDGGFILQKTVDWSLLNDGMTIPVSVCSLFRAWDESILTHGQSKDVRIMIDGEYGDSVVEAHHIDYFTRSQNNDSTNIIIISPNYHRIIHKNNPKFNRKKFQFEFANGEVLRLKLYEHLK